MDKKGILGLDTVKAVIMIILVLAILLIASLLALTTLQTTTESIDVKSGNAINESVSSTVNETGATFANLLRNKACGTVTNVLNQSTASNVSLTSGNYTQTGCTILFSGGAEDGLNINNTVWRVTYTYTYNTPYVAGVVDNISSGGTTFFGYVPTFFILLAVVVLILIIAIVIIAVSRFSGGSSLEREF